VNIFGEVLADKNKFYNHTVSSRVHSSTRHLRSSGNSINEYLSSSQGNLMQPQTENSTTLIGQVRSVRNSNTISHKVINMTENTGIDPDRLQRKVFDEESTSIKHERSAYNSTPTIPMKKHIRQVSSASNHRKNDFG